MRLSGRSPSARFLPETVEKYPDETAVAYVDREYKQTWREFSDTVDTMAKGLMAMGIQKGEKVAVWATNVPHWVALQFATARIGAILVDHQHQLSLRRN